MTTGADRRAARLAAGQWSVLDYGELLACGLTPSAIKVRVRRGVLHRIYVGVYAWGHHNIPVEGRWLAAVKACGPGAALGHYAAAAHWELVTMGRAADRHRSRSSTPTRGFRAHRRRHRAHVHRGHPRDTEAAHGHRSRAFEDEQTVRRALRQARFSEAELAQLPRRIVDLGADPTNSPLEDDALDFVVRHGLQRPA